MRVRTVSRASLIVAITTAACQDAPDRFDSDSDWLTSLAVPSLTEVWHLGELDGSSQDVFGKIGDAVVDPLHRIFVVDAMNDVVRVFGPEGRHIASAGREGQGPGEFVAAERVALAGGDTVLVTDRMGRISRFVLSGDNLEFEDSFSTSSTPEDICAMGDTIVAHGVPLGRAGIIQTFSPMGAELTAFGELNPGLNLIIQETYTWGSIECFGAPASILFVPNHSPELRLYDLTGALLRRDSIPGFRATPATARPDGGGSFRWYPPDGAHSVRSLVRLDSSSVLIQLALRDSTAKEVGDIVELQSLVWDLRQGLLPGRSSALPELVAVQGSYAYGHVREPYPQIIKYRMASRPD